MTNNDGDTDSSTPNDAPTPSRPRQVAIVYLRQSSLHQVLDQHADTGSSGGTQDDEQ
jgi:hypothetical protein